jgi:hypothetical protein
MANSEIIGAGQDTAHRAPKDIRVLIACEESQAVCCAFRALGFDAYSCDILPCSGGHPEWHIQGDVLPLLKKKWDMIVAFPPCTFLTCTANRVFAGNPTRWQQRLDAVKFVWEIYTADCQRIAIENPIGVLSTHISKPSQIIQPYHFGHATSKQTCLWLKGLPLLATTNTVEPEWVYPKSGGKRMSAVHANSPTTNSESNRVLRSKTFSGVAAAMAQQWGAHVLGEESPAQDTAEICHTAPNSTMLQGLKPHAGGTGTSA